jgi:hypothetical protein
MAQRVAQSSCRFSMAVRFLVLVGLLGAGFACAGLWLATPGLGSSPEVPFHIVLTNDAYSTLAVDHRGIAYGTARSGSTSLYRLYASADEGQTWSPIADFPSCSRLTDISVLTDDTLLAHVNNCSNVTIYRSVDHGVTWSPAFTFPQPVAYRTLTPHSITDDGQSVYIGSYNTLDDTQHENFVWRSDDDGQTWQVVSDTTTHRHIHFVQADPTTHWVYVGYGDAGVAEIDVTRDRGATWSPLCVGDACLAVDMAFDPSGFAIFGQDVPYGSDSIQRVDLTTGFVSTIMRLPGISYSTLRLRDGVWLVGTTFGAGTAYVPGDLDVHLFASIDGGHTFTDVYDTPYLDTNSYALKVQFSYPSGDFPIQTSGGGTVVARIGDPAASATTGETTTAATTTGETTTVGTTTAETTTAPTTTAETTTAETTTAETTTAKAADPASGSTTSTAASTPTTTPTGITSSVPTTASTPSDPAAQGSSSTGVGTSSSLGGLRRSDLDVVATADAKTITFGQKVTYSIVLSLANAVSATGVHLDVHLSPNLVVSNTQASRGSGCRVLDGSNIRCDFDSLSPGLTGDVTIGVRVAGSGSATLAAIVTQNAVDPDSSNNSVDLTLGAATPDAPAPAATTPHPRGGPAVNLQILGLARPGRKMSAHLTGPATKPTYSWELCSKARCRVIPNAVRSSVRLRREWKGQRLRVIVHLNTGGGRRLLTHETKRIH